MAVVFEFGHLFGRRRWRARRRCGARPTIRAGRGRCPGARRRRRRRALLAGRRLRRGLAAGAGRSAAWLSARAAMGGGARRDIGDGGGTTRSRNSRHADDADVAWPAGQGGVGALDRCELEGRDLAARLAPAVDVVAAAGVEHIADLVPIGGLARDHVDAVDGQHHQHPGGREVAQAQRVTRAGAAGHELTAVLVVDRRRPGRCRDRRPRSRPGAGGPCGAGAAAEHEDRGSAGGAEQAAPADGGGSMGVAHGAGLRWVDVQSCTQHGPGRG